jgi:nucleoid-associated protein YgaU
MTRETRIGLIVGLAFIVLFGVVLAELGPSDDMHEDKGDGVNESFYVRAPVTSPPQTSRQHEELSLTARRRTAAQGSETGRVAQQPAPAPRRRTQVPVVRPPRRIVPPVAPRRTVPTRPLVRRRTRVMTIEQLARLRGTITEAPSNSRIYVTRRGDSLTAIARKFYRTPSRKAVMKIFNANRTVLKSPDSLGVGVKIVIPK